MGLALHLFEFDSIVKIRKASIEGLIPLRLLSKKRSAGVNSRPEGSLDRDRRATVTPADFSLPIVVIHSSDYADILSVPYHFTIFAMYIKPSIHIHLFPLSHGATVYSVSYFITSIKREIACLCYA